MTSERINLTRAALDVANADAMRGIGYRPEAERGRERLNWADDGVVFGAYCAGVLSCLVLEWLVAGWLL